MAPIEGQGRGVCVLEKGARKIKKRESSQKTRQEGGPLPEIRRGFSLRVQPVQNFQDEKDGEQDQAVIAGRDGKGAKGAQTQVGKDFGGSLNPRVEEYGQKKP